MDLFLTFPPIRNNEIDLILVAKLQPTIDTSIIDRHPIGAYATQVRLLFFGCPFDDTIYY